MDQTKSSFDFENAFVRLENILEKMNSGNLSLNDSLKLYEEADQLISKCSQCLNDAEQKIEMLVKNRSGDLVIGANQKPVTQDFASEHTSSGLSFVTTNERRT